MDLTAELEGDMEKMPFHDTGPKLKEWSLAHHIRHSPVTVVFNVVILSLVTVLLIWVIATPDHNPRSGLYWLIEAIVTFAVVFVLAGAVEHVGVTGPADGAPREVHLEVGILSEQLRFVFVGDGHVLALAPVFGSILLM